jgi:biotin transport system substrate-specific component
MKNHTTRLCYCALLCALIIVSTLLFRFTIPGTDVMVTLQVLFVLLCGQLLPVRYCLYTTGAYLLAGLIGLPVFSAVNGPAVLATPSFGYLVAFPAAACVCSYVRQRNKKGSRYMASFAGVLLMYGIAAVYILLLSKVLMQGSFSPKSILTGYVLVFLPLDLIKGVLAAWLGQRLSRSVFRQL